MKKLFKNITLALAFIPAVAFGQAFSGVGTAVSTTVSYYVSSPLAGSGTPIINDVDASFAGADTNSASACIRFYKADQERTPSGASASGASTITGSTNGLVANDVIVVRYKSNDTYQRVTVSSLSGSTITLNETLSAAVATTDSFYRMTLSGRIGNAIHHNPGGKISRSGAGAPVFCGIAGRPTLTEAFGAATPILNNASGTFLTPK